jgi:hypothetical protein
VIFDSLQVCSCCLVWIANNDDSGCRDQCGESGPDNPEHPHHPGTFPGLGLELDPSAVPVPSGAGDEPSTFSDTDCASCGSRLAGDRSPVAVLSSHPDIWSIVRLSTTTTTPTE